MRGAVLLLGFCFLFIGDGAFAKKKMTTLDHTIRVWILDWAGIDAASLVNAKRAVEKIYEKTGVQITWIYCGGESAGPAPRSSESRRLSPLDLMLRIRPAHPSDSPAHGSEFGKAYLGSGHSRIADVYYGRVKSATFDKLYVGLDRLATPLPPSTRPGVTLGVVMAHELGHLLLGSHNHSARGVMKPQWSRDDLMKAYFGGLGFNREQIKRIRSSVVAREQGERERTKERVSADVR